METRLALQERPWAWHVGIFSICVLGYFFFGVAGLQLQSAQTGVTPLWPASGFVFAIIYWHGIGHALGILPAMTFIGWLLGLPIEAVLLSAAGAMLEAVVPVLLLHRAGFDPSMRSLRDASLFIVLGPLLGPALSASVGSLAFHWLGESSLDSVRLWLMWWLGNSIGLLLVGGLGLVAVARRSLRFDGRPTLELTIAVGTVAAITFVGMLQIDSISSPLLLYLLIPVFVLIAQRGEQLSVLVLGSVAMAAMLLASQWLPEESLALADLGIPYLDVSLLWVVTFTGMMIASARQEMRSREEVSWLANHDPLTRLLNRHAFMDRLEVGLSRLNGDSSQQVLLFLDLDKFKVLNDAEGHRAGDQVLRDVGVLLVEEVRAADQVSRLAGDEFALLLEDCALLNACAIAENIRAGIERYEYRGARGVHRVEASIGLVELTPRHASPEDALHDADSACYAAKRGGRNRVWVFSEELASSST